MARGAFETGGRGGQGAEISGRFTPAVTCTAAACSWPVVSRRCYQVHVVADAVLAAKVFMPEGPRCERHGVGREVLKSRPCLSCEQCFTSRIHDR